MTAGDPEAPTGVTASPLAANRVKVAWSDNSLRENRVYVERSADGGTTWQPRADLAASSTSFYDGDVTPGQAYVYRVRHSYPGSTTTYSAYSSPATATLPDLAAPGAVVAAAASGTRVNLAWTDTNDVEHEYEVERSEDGATWSRLYTGGGASRTSHADTDLTPGRDYSYRLRARYYGGPGGQVYSAYSAVASATTTPFAGPSDLVATVVSGTRVDLAWVDTSDNEDGFEVDRAEAGSSTWTRVGSSQPADRTAVTDANLTPRRPRRSPRPRWARRQNWSPPARHPRASTLPGVTTRTQRTVTRSSGPRTAARAGPRSGRSARIRPRTPTRT